jgi:addiction module HigA family antidote
MGRAAIHPGEHLAEQLEELAMSAAELGRQLGVPTSRITAILNGQRSVTGDTALRLGHFFGNNPQFWLNLQALYDLRTAEKKLGGVINALPTLRADRRKRRGAGCSRRDGNQARRKIFEHGPFGGPFDCSIST